MVPTPRGRQLVGFALSVPHTVLYVAPSLLEMYTIARLSMAVMHLVTGGKLMQGNPLLR